MGKKQKQKHMTKNELLYHLRGMSRLNLYGVGVAYRDAAVLTNHILWKSEKFKTNQFVKFNELVNKKFQDNESLDEINKRLKRKANFTVSVSECTLADIPRTGNKAIDSIRVGMIDIDNEINDMTRKYILYTYDSLMDMGFGKTRLTRIKQKISEEITFIETATIELYQKELMDEIGLLIELPDGF